jgi:hypothetical protein
VRSWERVKTASDGMNSSGTGLTGTDKSTYQEYMVDNVCKYYFDLLPVLGNRPNIQPHFTNEGEPSEEVNDSGDDDLEDDSESLFDENGNRINNSTTINVIDISDNVSTNEFNTTQDVSNSNDSSLSVNPPCDITNK